MDATEPKQRESAKPAIPGFGQGLTEAEQERARVLFDRARRGDPAVREEVNELLDLNPRFWRAQGNIRWLLEQMFIDRIARGDLLVEGSIRRRLEQLKRDLVGEQPNALEQLLIDRIGVAWLAIVQTEIAELEDTSNSRASRYRLQRAESANRRFVAATRALATVRRLGVGIRVEIKHVATAAADTAKPAAPVAERLSSLLGAERKLDTALAGSAL